MIKNLSNNKVYLALVLVVLWLPRVYGNHRDPTPSLQASLPTSKVNAFFIKKIVLEDAKFITRQQKRKLLKPYIHKYIDSRQINQLIKDIKNFYIKKGYPLINVKVPPGQNLKAGSFTLTVIHGFVEDITWGKNTLRDQIKIFMAFPFFKKKPLSLKALSQGIDQFNALPSNKAHARILPGNYKGGSIIQIDNTVTNPLRVEVGLENGGQKEIGRIQGRMNIGIDNLMSINDNIKICYLQSFPEIKHTYSKNFTTIFTFPLEYYNFTTNYSKTNLLKIVSKKRKEIKYINNNNKTEMNVKRVLYKTRRHKLFFRLGLSHTRLQAFVNDVKLNNQSINLTSYKVGVLCTGVLLKGLYMAEVSYAQGLRLLGAKKDSQVPNLSEPKSQFKKVNFSLSWLRSFQLLKINWNYQFTMNTQYCKDLLYSFEQFNLAQTVRGSQQSQGDDQGVCLKNEITCTNLWQGSKLLTPLNFSFSLEFGYLQQATASLLNLGHPGLTKVVSGVAGINYPNDWLVLDVYYVKPIHKMSYPANNTSQVQVSLSFKLHSLRRYRR